MSDLGEDYYSSGVSRLSINDEPQFDEYENVQAELLGKGRQIELFLDMNRDSRGGETCFALLEMLFNLFKSEFMTNMSLRKALVQHENQLREYFKYKSQIKSIQSLMNDKMTLNEISELVSEYSANNMFNSGIINKAQDQLRASEQATEQCQGELLLINEKVAEVRQRREMVDSRRVALDALMVKENNLKDQLNRLKREKADIELHMVDSNKTLTEQLALIQQKVKQTETNMHTVTEAHKEQIAKLERKKRRLEADINDRRGAFTEFEEELDSIHKKIDYLTDPLVIKKRGRDTPHLTRYQLFDMQQKCEQLQRSLREETSEVSDIQGQIEETTDTITELESLIRKQNDELRELKRLCALGETNLQEMKKLSEALNNKRKVVKKLDRARRKMLSEKIRVKHGLEISRSKVRELEIDAHSLGKSLKVAEDSRDKNAKTLKRVTVSEFNTMRFNEIVNAFKTIRNELDMPEDATPIDILSLFCNVN